MRNINITKNISLQSLLISALSIFYVPTLLAESTSERLPEFEDVYRIELIIFTNRGNLDDVSSGSSSSDNDVSQVREDWSAKPELSYPDNLVFLHPPRPEPATPKHNESIVDIQPPQREELAETLIDSELASAAEDTRTVVEKALASLPLLEYLNPETHLLKDMAKSIGRRSNHQVLFHQAWHQELGAAETAPSIPISGGEVFDQHHELEGSIKLNKDRYLHITSDLWLTQYVLREDEQWEKITQEATENSLLTAKIIDTKAVPSFPQDLIRMAEDAAILEAELAKHLEDEALYEYTLEQDEQAVNLVYSSSEFEPEEKRAADISGIGGIGDIAVDVEATDDDIDLLLSDATELSFDRFEANKTYVLKEHRKMKRAEVHFLDHPMMGLIIQITKYEVPVNAEGAENTEGS